MKNMYDEILKVLLKSSTTLSIYKKKTKKFVQKTKKYIFSLTFNKFNWFSFNKKLNFFQVTGKPRIAAHE